MRVPQSPKSLRRVMTVSSVRSDDEGASSGSEDSTVTSSSRSTFKKFRTATDSIDSTKPPKPTYTSRVKDGKFTVGVEAPLFVPVKASAEIIDNKNGNEDATMSNDSDVKKVDGTAPSFHRSRERTRVSAVQRLVERKLAQKERERLRERELERDRLSHHLNGKARNSSRSSFFRDRSWDATYHRNLTADVSNEQKANSNSRSGSENEYLASLLWRTRSCSATRLRGEDEEVAKTIITIGPGKPTRIREHSPSKRSPTSEVPPSAFGSVSVDNGQDSDRSTPVKQEPLARDPSPSKKSETLFKHTTPLKSTGLFREFSRTSSAKTEKRKTSFTTEKTFLINADHGTESEKARRLSIDCNYVYERSPPSFTTFSQAEEKQVPVSSSTSSLTSSFSFTEESSTEKEPISLGRLRPATFPSALNEQDELSSPPEPPIRERKTSRRIFISSAFNRNGDNSCGDDTSSNVSSCSSGTDDSINADASKPFSSASSKLLFNLSSGYRYHRANAAANSPLKSRRININVMNSDENYPRRRFSQEHATKDEDTLGEIFVSKRPVREPLRKISCPVRPTGFGTSSTRKEAESMADQKKEEGNDLYKTSNYREALQKYSEAIKLCPDIPAFYGNRAACYMMLLQYARALEDAKMSVQLDPMFTKGYIRIAKCCIATGDIAAAKQALDTASKLEPTNSAVMQETNSLKNVEKFDSDAQTAFNAGDYRKALFCVDRGLEVAKASRHLKILRAECLAYLGRYGESQELANDLLRQDSTNVDAIYVRGLCLYYEDNVDKAFTHFQQVLRFAPDHQRAKDAYKKAKQLKQTKEEGNAAFKTGKFSEAYDLYSQALNIDPCNKFTNAKLYFNRATVAAKLKKLKESVDDCSAALDLDPKYMKALLRRAKSYLELEMFEEAVRDYETAQRNDRGNHEVRQLLQHAKLELKKSKRKDYYKILGVDRNASEDEIKKAYRKRALVHHPDRHSSATEEEKKEHEKKFKEIGEAYGVLSDSKKRSRYDSGVDIEDLDSGHGGFGGDIDPNEIFRAFFGGGGMGGGGMGGGGMGGHHSFNFGGPGQMPGGFQFHFG